MTALLEYLVYKIQLAKSVFDSWTQHTISVASDFIATAMEFTRHAHY